MKLFVLGKRGINSPRAEINISNNSKYRKVEISQLKKNRYNFEKLVRLFQLQYFHHYKRNQIFIMFAKRELKCGGGDVCVCVGEVRLSYWWWWWW